MRTTCLFAILAVSACATNSPPQPTDAPDRAMHTWGVTNTLDDQIEDAIDGDGDGVPLSQDCDDADYHVGALLYESSLDSGDSADFVAPPQLGDNWSWASGVTMANDGGQQGALSQTDGWGNVVVYAQLSAAGTEIGCGFDCHSECEPFEPEDGCLTQAQAIALGVISVSTTGSGAFTVTNSHPDWDICLDGYVMYDNVGTQALFIGSEEGFDFRIPAGGSSTFYYASWTTANGSYQPFLGSWSMWCFQQGTVMGSHSGYLSLGAMIPAGIAELVQNDTDLDGDGVEDHVDYVSYSGVQTQYNIWDYQNNHAALAVGKLASDAGDGSVTVDYSVTNRGATRGDGTLTDTLPAWWVLEGCDVTPDSVTVNEDHTTTLSWAVSVEGCDGDCSTVYEDAISCSIAYGPHTDLVYTELPAASVTYHDGEQSRTNSSLEVALFDYDWNADGELSCGETDRWRAGILVRAETDADQDEGFHGYRCALAHNAEANCYEDGHFLQIGEFMDTPEDDISSECNGSCENPSFDELGRSNHDGSIDIAGGDVATLSFWAVGENLYCVAEDQEGNSAVVGAYDDSFGNGTTGFSTLNMYGVYDWIRVCEAFSLPVD